MAETVDNSGREQFQQWLVEAEEQLSKRLDHSDWVVKLAHDQSAHAARRAAALWTDLADAHERAARAYELAATAGLSADCQMQATRHRELAAAALRHSEGEGLPGNTLNCPPPGRAGLQHRLA